jgi:hypothetical protein
MVAMEGLREMSMTTKEPATSKDLNVLDLNKYNVYPEYREGQKEAIQSILDTYEKIRSNEINSKVVELPSPTGSGKTVIN